MFIFLSPIVIEKCNIPVKCRNKYSDPAVFKREIFVKFVKKKKVFLFVVQKKFENLNFVSCEIFWP